MTPALRSSDWLPVCQNIDFIILLSDYKALNGLQAEYISDLIRVRTKQGTTCPEQTPRELEVCFSSQFF